MANPIQSYRDLIVWQKTFDLGLHVHRLAGVLPEAERFGLISHLRRSAILTPSYIADGYGRSGPEYPRLLKSARGVVYQMDTQLLFAKELEYLDDQQYESAKRRVDESERVLAGLIRSLGG
jgi:four helix bundle protein